MKKEEMNMRRTRKKETRILAAVLTAAMLFGCTAGAAEDILIEPEEMIQSEGSSTEAGISLGEAGISSDDLSIEEMEIIAVPQPGEDPGISSEEQNGVNMEAAAASQESGTLDVTEGATDDGNPNVMAGIQDSGELETASVILEDTGTEDIREAEETQAAVSETGALQEQTENPADALPAETSAEEKEEPAAEDGFVLEIEESGEGDVPETETEESEVFAEDMDLVTLADCGEALDASFSMIRAFSVSQYETCYGEQLDGESSKIYNSMKDSWTSGGTGNVTYTFSAPLTFTAEGTITDGSAQWDKDNCEEYQELLSAIRYEVQSAFDAFIYDYPEVFWLNNISYSYRTSLSSIAGTPGQLRGSIAGLTITGNERYSGAKSETAAFQNAVAAAVAGINNSLPSGAGTYDKVRAIHDYICNTAAYGKGSYAYTPAGIFLKDKIVVCEGYAKSLKILCGRFGIPCALIVGTAKNKNGGTEAHMWNYVKMEDGVWYLVDATWDDQADKIYDTYFLAGAGSQGFYAVMSEERQIYTNFSGTSGAKSFAVPVLSQTAYQKEEHNWQEISRMEPTCQKNGTIEYKCTDCGRTKTEYLPAETHSWGTYASNGDATCAKDGTKTAKCVFGCGTTNTIADPGSKTGHIYVNYVSDKNASCTRDGTKTAKCKFGCGTTNTITDPGSKKGHSYSGKWTIDKAATCLTAGSKSHHCTVCGAKKNVTKIKKLTPTIKLSATKVVLTIGKAGKTIKVSKLGKGDKVKSWKSSDTSVAKVSSKGKITPQKKAGKATVTVTLASGLKKKISVTVQKDPSRTAKITGISKTLTLKKGKTKTLKPVLTPKTSKEKVTYSSSNKKVAAVSSKGKITAKKKGTAVITVKSGKISVKCKVVVK